MCKSYELGTLLLIWINFDPSMDCIHYEMWDEFTYPSPNFNGATGPWRGGLLVPVTDIKAKYPTTITESTARFPQTPLAILNDGNGLLPWQS